MNLAVIACILCFTALLKVDAEVAQPPARTAYDENLSRRLLLLAAGSYSTSPNECASKSFPDSHQIVTIHNETCDEVNNLCFFYSVVSKNSNEIYIIFRGTKTKKQLFMESWQTLQSNIDFFQIGKVNRYFFRAHVILWDNVLHLLNDPKYENFTVIFTGHSLGGALASLGALRTVLCKIRRSDQVKLYTFGQPRVGDITLAQNHDRLVPHSFRVINRFDIVPHFAACAKNKADPRVDGSSDSLPCDPKAVGIAYHHGTEIWYPNGMAKGEKYYECLGTPKNEDFDCSDMLSFKLSHYELYIADHRHYFNQRVPVWGKLGCSTTYTQEDVNSLEMTTESPSKISKVINWFIHGK